MDLPGNLLAALYASVDRSGTCEDFLTRLREATGARVTEWWWLPDETGSGCPSLRAWSPDPDIHRTTTDVATAGIAGERCNGCHVVDTGDGLGILGRPCHHDGVELVRVRACPDEGQSGARNLLEALHPHVVRSCELARQIPPSAADAAPIRLPVLDMLNAGVLLVDGSLKVLVMNRYADEVVAAEDAGLVLRDGQLRARVDGAVDQRLQADLGAATRHAPSADMPPSSTILLDRPDLQARCIVRIWPLARADADIPAARALVLITDLHRDPGVSAAALCECFRLTASEGHIATLLLSGQSTKEIAVSLNQRESTVRQHVKSILRKTGTGRQAELVRVLTRAFSVFRM